VNAARRPSVILLGDSIRVNYQPHVRLELGEAFDLHGPAENCATSRNLLANLDRWAFTAPASVIHLNAGLHDLRYDPGQDAPVVPIGEYESNVRTILGRLRQRSNARLIWATTTPVHEKLHAEHKLSRRRDSDVGSYNAVATAVARELGVEVDDLCAAVLAHGPDALWSQDGVHFNDAGYRFLGAQVARELGVEVDDLCAAVLAHGPDALWSQDGVHFNDAGYRFLGAQVARAIRGG
jgi:lysophospholipase L1-like esterase